MPVNVGRYLVNLNITMASAGEGTTLSNNMEYVYQNYICIGDLTVVNIEERFTTKASKINKNIWIN